MKIETYFTGTKSVIISTPDQSGELDDTTMVAPEPEPQPEPQPKPK